MSKRLGLFTVCPACGYRLEAHSAIDDRPAQPKAGDISLCIGCGQLLCYELDMVGLRLRLPTVTELVEMRQNPVVEQLLEAWVSAFERTPETRTA